MTKISIEPEKVFCMVPALRRWDECTPFKMRFSGSKTFLSCASVYALVWINQMIEEPVSGRMLSCRKKVTSIKMYGEGDMIIRVR